MTELTAEQTGIIDKVEKLLRLANKNPNEAEAAAAAAKAQALLVAYNLDVAMIGELSAGDVKREQARLKGGAYTHQRKLWRSVAELNFCKYWCDQKYIHYNVKAKHFDGTPYMRDWARLQWHHFLVGRVVNTAATRVMAEYLEQAIERMLRQRLADEITGIVPHTQLFSRWAVSYRSGATRRVCEKINERRDEMLEEENAKRAAAARDGVSTSNALTISTYVDAETDANNDFLHGEGWSARRAAQRAEQAAAARAAEEEYTRWAAEHPEEARKQEEEQRKENEKYWARRRGGRRASYKESNVDNGAYFAGYDAAESISIDQQVGTKDQKRIGR